MKDPLRLPVSCNKDCGAGCPLLAEVENGRLLRIRDNPRRPPHMTGCVRGYQMTRAVYHPQRLSSPLLRSGPRGSGQFREVRWDEALQYVCERLDGIRSTWGPEAVLRLGGSGSCRGALHNTALLTRRFLSQFGGYTDITGSYSSGAESFVTPYLFGPGYARRTSVGFDFLERYIRGDTDGQPKTPSWAEKICGVPQKTIVQLARQYGRSKPAALIPGLSIQRTLGGEEAIRCSRSSGSTRNRPRWKATG